MVDAFIGETNVVVTGGPSKIDLQVDLGPRGLRGSYFFYGIGNPNNPNNTSFPRNEAELYDYFINIDLIDQVDYLQIYQYQFGPSGAIWTKVANLSVNLLSRNQEVTFQNGLATVRIPVTDIISLDVLAAIPSNLLTPDIFCVQAAIQSIYVATNGVENNTNSKPIAFSFTSSPFDTNDVNNERESIDLVLNFKASEMDLQTNAWQKINGSEKIINLFISLAGGILPEV